LITHARALDAGDLDLPDRSPGTGIDAAELEARAAAAETRLLKASKDLKAPLAAPGSADLEKLRDLMLRAAGFGVAGAVPLSAAGAADADRKALIAQAGSIQKELLARADQLAKLAAGFAAAQASLDARRDHALARMRILFGKAFLVLPRFAAQNAGELAKSLAGSVRIQDGDPMASLTWFRRMSRVREGVARLDAAVGYAEAAETGEKLSLSIAQLPHVSEERWVALPLQAGRGLPGGKLSIAVQSSSALDVGKPLAGLLVDEWVETVPGASETTGIALPYDRPNSAPPQAMLLAVPPELEAPWTVGTLQQVLLETLDLARVRAVDPDALDEVGQFLPAACFAVNTAGDTVATDFTRIKT
jgi:hypothetical protein